MPCAWYVCVCACMYMCVHACVRQVEELAHAIEHMWRPKDNSVELILSFYLYVASGDACIASVFTHRVILWGQT